MLNIQLKSCMTEVKNSKKENSELDKNKNLVVELVSKLGTKIKIAYLYLHNKKVLFAKMTTLKLKLNEMN